MQQRLGKYELLERIGQGGQGTVYRARDTDLDRIVAIKVIDQSVVDDPAYSDALRREARLAASLDHPNVVTVYDFQVEDGTAYIVMEYVPNALDRLLASQRRLSPRRASEIAAQICLGLANAHENGVVHRDIKPANILLTANGDVKISDFGIARALASSTRSRGTSVMGTPYYMAPEQWNESNVDGRADIYSLGILLYEMLTGSVPFRASTIEAIYVQHQNARIPDIPRNLNVPSGLEDALKKSLAKRSDLRFQSADDMKKALIASADHRRKPTLEVPPGSSNQEQPGGKRPIWLWGVGAAAIVLLAIFATLVLGLDSNIRIQVEEKDIPTVVPTRASTAILKIETPPTATYLSMPTHVRPTNNAQTSTPYSQAFAHFDIGREFLKKGKHRLAISEYTKAIDIYSAEVAFFFDRGISYELVGNHTLAISDFDKVIQVDPSQADGDSLEIYAYAWRAESHANMGQHHLAIQDWDAAIELDPTEDMLYLQRGIAYAELGNGQPLKAIEDFDKFIGENPEARSEAYHQRANAHWNIGQYTIAEKDHEMACSLNVERSEKGLEALTNCHDSSRPTPEITPHFSQVCKDSPWFPSEYITFSGSGFPALSNISSVQIGPTDVTPQYKKYKTDELGSLQSIFVDSVWSETIPYGSYPMRVKVNDAIAQSLIEIVRPEESPRCTSEGYQIANQRVGSVAINTDTAMSGDIVTLNGMWFPSGTRAHSIKIDEVDVLPDIPIITGSEGDFQVDIKLPILDPGTQTIEILVGKEKGYVAITIVW